MIYNYRLSRARRVVENAFGILASRFQIYRAPFNLHPDKVETLVLATISLHNYLRTTSCTRKIYSPLGTFDTADPVNGEIYAGSWRRQNMKPDGLLSLSPSKVRNAKLTTKAIREEICEYVNREGYVPWQRKLAFVDNEVYDAPNM